MNILVPRFVKATYRKEPISSFILVIGAVDVLIGGVDERWTLFSLGMMIVLIAIALRWWNTQKPQPTQRDNAARRYLPASSSAPRTPLPVLTPKQRRP